MAKKKFPKTVSIAFDGEGDSQCMIAAVDPGDHCTLHETVHVGIYRLVEVAIVKNESRIVSTTKTNRR